jgi:hypothetical protein
MEAQDGKKYLDQDEALNIAKKMGRNRYFLF